MKNLLTHGRKLAVAVVLACSWPAWAQSLGQAAGELWIGRPLELTVPARFRSADSSDACVHAEVAYGDARLAAAKVNTTVIGEGEHRSVRITSDQVVDEPLVTVTLRAGCGSTLTRSYALLPDMPSEAVLARLMQPAPRAVAAAMPLRPAANRMAVRADARPAGLHLTPAMARMGAAPAHLRTARAYRAQRPAAAGPRLRLDAIEADASSLLRVSAHLSPPGDAALRARAAMLWQAISADPQDLVRGDAALQKLENELAQLRSAAGSTRTEMASLRRRFDEAQPWYLSPRMVQGLALIVLATAGAVALFAWRTRRAAGGLPWYTPSERAPLLPQSAGAPQAGDSSFAPLVAQRGAEGIVAADTTSSDRPLSASLPQAANTASAFEPLEFDLAPAGGGQPPASPRPASSGLLRVETLAAIFEEVEFLSSLGLHSDAMDVLKGYLEDSGNPAPVAFFELMRICSLADDPQAVQAVQRRYTKVHGVPAPTLAQVSAATGLEQQRALAERVTRAWGTPDVLPVIEHALFDVLAPGAALTVQAARDLICLHDVAMLLATDASIAPRGAQDEPLAPWAHAEHLGEAHAFTQAVAEDVGGDRFALDVDLSVVPVTLPEKAHEPDPQELAALLLAQKEAARQAAERAAREAEDAFSAAVASERAPISRY
ncbi:hypothetical protein [Ramlibacter sp. AN1133]|uniref:hypothetical protein n=1 Tax=Ramlibacter sp. AN1133 TaxID=3133429 RepID=UPI0030C30B6C